MMSTKRLQRGAQLAPLVIAIAVAALSAGAGYWFGMRHTPAPAGAHTGTIAMAPAASTATVATPPRKVLYWHDPMVPGQKFDKPGKSPFMDMELVPVYADAGTDAGSVTISPRVVQNFGVRTIEVREGALESGFNAVGVVTINERLLTAVQARSPGYIEKLYVRAQYDAVAAGQPLVDLYVPDWLVAEEELLALKASTQPGVLQIVDAARQRLRQLGVPEGEIAKVERDRKPSPRITVPAPESGIVWEIGVRDGMSINPGMTLFKLAGLETVWVTADIPEAQAGLARVGLPVEARAAGYPDHVFKGAITAILPELNAVTRTVRARIELANPDGLLKPGMFATVAFAGASAKASVLVPAEAVIRTGKRNVVIVDAGNGRFTPVAVELGRESADLAEVRKGLEKGQRVVVSGQFLVDSEASLKGVLARLATSGPDTAPAPAPGAEGGQPAGAMPMPPPATAGGKK